MRLSRSGNPGTRRGRAGGVCSAEEFRWTAEPIRVRLPSWPPAPGRFSNTLTASLPPGLASLWVSVLRSLCLHGCLNTAGVSQVELFPTGRSQSCLHCL